MIRKDFTEEIDSNPYKSGLLFVHFSIDQQSVEAKLYYINGRLKEVMYGSLKEIC